MHVYLCRVLTPASVEGAFPLFTRTPFSYTHIYNVFFFLVLSTVTHVRTCGPPHDTIYVFVHLKTTLKTVFLFFFVLLSCFSLLLLSLTQFFVIHSKKKTQSCFLSKKKIHTEARIHTAHGEKRRANAMRRSRLSATAAPHPLHVLCACDAFKGTLPSDKVGEAVEAGYRRVWKKLHDVKEEGRDALKARTLPPVTTPPQHHTQVEDAALPPIAAEALAETLFMHLEDCSHLRDQPLVGDNQPQPPSAEELHTPSANTKTVSSATTVMRIAADFSHTPMSDGGAGLLDSVTFATSLEKEKQKQKTTSEGGHQTGSAAAAAANATSASATTNAAAAGGAAAATFHAPPVPSEALHLQRVYVPSTTTITGPLGSPIPHVDESTTAADDSAASVGPGAVSFACDVARRVLVVEMAEAAGLPRIARPHDRNPTRTTSYGVGELIRYALHFMGEELRKATAEEEKGKEESEASAHNGSEKANHNVDPPSAQEKRRKNDVRLFLGIGGSSTNDGGLGALQALGLEIFVQPTASSSTSTSAETDGVLLDQPFCGADLGRLTHVRISEAMQRLFPYLAGNSSALPADDDNNETALFIAEVCLICDVDNPLVGPRGATYTFGPQKCAPPQASTTASHSSSGASKSAAAGDDDDAAVGAITSAEQKALLDSLEAGMRHAATRVVASTWQQLVPRPAWPGVRPSTAAAARSNAQPQEEEERETEEAVQADVLYSPGGGGAGGMSGFFRYLLKASYVPGADVVGGLLGLYETPHVAHLLGSDGEDPTRTSTAASAASALQREGMLTLDSPTVKQPCGCLFHACDVVVSGEGSFDDQTISSHKTVGRLLEMCTAANAYRLWRHYCEETPRHTKHEENNGEAGRNDARSVDPSQRQQVQPQHHQHHPLGAAFSKYRCASPDKGCRTIQEFIVVCGRTNFEDYATCQSDVIKSLCRTLSLPPSNPNATGTNTVKTRDERGEAATESSEHRCDADVVRVNLYLKELQRSASFLQHCDGHRPTGGGNDSASILKRCCVPRVTVLPLTPTLFSFTDATQRPYACVVSAVADLLEDSARRIARADAEAEVPAKKEVC